MTARDADNSFQAKETDMPKLNSKTALDFARRIENLNNEISLVYREVCDLYGANEVNLVRDIVTAREAVKEAEYEADALLAAIDVDDDEL